VNKNEIELNCLTNELHKQLYNVENSIEYKVGKRIVNSLLFKVFFRVRNLFFTKKLPHKKNVFYKMLNYDNDFTNLENKKIAVYTCITGDYDKVIDPMYCNDSIDYFLFTNNNLIESSKWKVTYIKNEKGFDNVLLNRYLKMHPQEYLKDYDYTIYVDGNIKIISDISCYINKVNENIGFALSKHSTRDNLDDELIACKKLKKGNIKMIDMTIKKYYLERYAKELWLVRSTSYSDKSKE